MVYAADRFDEDLRTLNLGSRYSGPMSGSIEWVFGLAEPLVREIRDQVGTTKRQVAAMFAKEKPHLLPLPLEPFRYYQYGERGRPSGRLRGSGGRVLRLAAGMDRAASEGAMG
jgi:hypothetical protein